MMPFDVSPMMNLPSHLENGVIVRASNNYLPTANRMATPSIRIKEHVFHIPEPSGGIVPQDAKTEEKDQKLLESKSKAE